jgi:hypothetical protein
MSVSLVVLDGDLSSGVIERLEKLLQLDLQIPFAFL